VLDLVRSMKNNLAPINQIPSEVFSLLPEYLEGYHGDEGLISMSHVCRSWRELLIARSSLWAHLDCKNTDKTRVYIERSKSSPLELSLFKYRSADYIEDGILLVVPHISRLKSLSIDGRVDLLRFLTPYLSCPIPLLRELTIAFNCDPAPVLDGMLFNGDLSSLCSLSLGGVITHLPWKNLSKLTTFELCRIPGDKISITQLLNFFEDANRLSDIMLRDSIPTLSNALPGRVVSLPYLKKFTIFAEDPVHPILLNHLSIPTGASLTMEFTLRVGESPLPDLLPNTLNNLRNISSISSVDLFLGDFDKFVRLDGPNGGLYMLGQWIDFDGAHGFTVNNQVLRSLSRFDLSGTQRLVVTQYESSTVDTVDNSALYHILSRMKDLRTLTLSLAQYNDLPFILALDPAQNPSKRVLCPKLEEFTLHVWEPKSLEIEELKSMVKERASAGRKLSSITIHDLDEVMLESEIFELKKFIAHVDHIVGEDPAKRDSTSEGGGK